MRLSDLARGSGVDKSTVTRWSKSRVPAERVGEVSRITGIPVEVLRPDIFKAPETTP